MSQKEFTKTPEKSTLTHHGSYINTKDGTGIYYKDWGEGPAVTFSHGWPQNADAWDGQMIFLVQHGFRVIAHDRRGHGRSSQASTGNDMNGYADDLAMGYLLAAERNTGSEVFHFAGPTQPTVRELVSAIVRVTGFNSSVHYLPLEQALQSMGPNAEAIALDLALDSSKAQRLLGWIARHVGFIPEAETYFASWKAWRISGEVVHANA